MSKRNGKGSQDSEIERLRRELEKTQLQNAELFRFQQLYQQQLYAGYSQQSAGHVISVVQCPSTSSYHNPQIINLYLGGSSSQDNWQGVIIDKLRQTVDANRNPLCVYNPRRADWKQSEKAVQEQAADGKDVSQFSQFSWELEHLNRSNCAVFWFPWDEDKNAACTYLQLGSCSHSGKNVFLGIHSRHKNKKVLYEYIKTFVPNAFVTSSFDKLVTNVANWAVTGRMPETASSGGSSDDAVSLQSGYARR